MVTPNLIMDTIFLLKVLCKESQADQVFKLVMQRYNFVCSYETLDEFLSIVTRQNIIGLFGRDQLYDMVLALSYRFIFIDKIFQFDSLGGGDGNLKFIELAHTAAACCLMAREQDVSELQALSARYEKNITIWSAESFLQMIEKEELQKQQLLELRQMTEFIARLGSGSCC